MNEFSKPIEVASADAMHQLGHALAAQLVAGDVVYLSGPLGAGKTTLAQAIVRGLGFSGRVKSPSYGLIELYPINGLIVVHLDLYRLSAAEQVADLGLEAYTTAGSADKADTVMLIEWPSRGEGHLPPASWVVEIEDGLGASGPTSEPGITHRRVTVSQR